MVFIILLLLIPFYLSFFFLRCAGLTADRRTVFPPVLSGTSDV